MTTCAPAQDQADRHVVADSLALARKDIEDASVALSVCSTADDHVTTIYLTTAAEALMRAMASVSLAVERLAELLVCEGAC